MADYTIEKLKDADGNNFAFRDPTKATPTDITNAINALDVSDSAETNQFVTKVSETDGKISVSRAQPQISDVKDLQTTLNSKAADSNVVHKTGDETILGIKSFGGGIAISTGNRNFKCCRELAYTMYTTSSTSPLPNIASAVVNGVYNIGSSDSQAIAAGYIAGHRYSKLSSTAESYTDVTTGYCKRARIRLNARSTSAFIDGTLRILLTSTYGSGNNFGAISWNWNGAIPNNATRTTNYMSYTWCDWAAYDVSNDWRIFGPCWDSQTEGWYIEIINKGALNANANGAVLYIESYGNSARSINPLYYATLNDVNILNTNSARLEIIPTPTTISQLRNGAWEDVNVSTYRHIPEVPDSKNRSKVRELFHTGSTIPIANGGTGNTDGKAVYAQYLEGNGRVTNANSLIAIPRTTAVHARLDIASSSMTVGKPRSDGKIITLTWDNSNYANQIFIPNPDKANQNWQVRGNVLGTWSEWTDLKVALADKATDSDKLGGQLPSYYATKSEIPDVSGKENTSNKVTTLDNSTTHYPSTSAVTTALSEKQDTISDIATIRSNATNGQTAYGWGDHANAGYLTDADLSGYAKADGSNASGTWAKYSEGIDGHYKEHGTHTYLKLGTITGNYNIYAGLVFVVNIRQNNTRNDTGILTIRKYEYGNDAVFGDTANTSNFVVLDARNPTVTPRAKFYTVSNVSGNTATIDLYVDCNVQMGISLLTCPKGVTWTPNQQIVSSIPTGAETVPSYRAALTNRTAATGSPTQPVYVDESGQVTACEVYFV